MNTDKTIQISFPDEIQALEEMNVKLEEALKKADDRVWRIDKEYMAEKRYMAQYRGELDPHEMFQNELSLKQTDSSGAFAVRVREQIVKLKDSPYFARIDFKENGTDKISSHYIGAFAFNHNGKLLISDWRSPVASMFYDCEVGQAGYNAPMGKIDGELTRKRQFKIKQGTMEYALETSVNIQDDVLQRELSHTSDDKMKSIIATIQKEQNQIIRNEKAGTMIIQGVAGSGKTSIALHRIAFLLYRFKDRLTARNITILSPNKVFGDYISNVLPELGEEPIYELSFADIANIQLDGSMNFEPDKDPLEPHEEAWAARVRFKSTLNFVKLINQYLSERSGLVFQPFDYTYKTFTAKADFIKNRFDAYFNYPIKQRLSMIADDIFDRFTTDNFLENEVPNPRTILKTLNTMLTMKSTLALYKDFYKQMGISHLLVMPDKKTLEWADVYPFLYFHSAYAGLKESSMIRHLVVDEMQDYTPIQYAVLNKLFPCQKTILGDFGQFINPNHNHTLEDLRHLYDNAELITLNKSYRSTCEIIQFAKRIQNVTSLEPVARHGEAPLLFSCNSNQEELIEIIAAINSFRQSGYASLGIIVKTNAYAKILFKKLPQNLKIHLLSPESDRFQNGITITSIPMSKGLEFDMVVIPEVNNHTYSTEYDRSLLYIACTRAMHQLTITYTGELSRLIE